MKVLVGCEYSGRVRQAFRDKGHDAWSCDLLPCEDNSPYHIQGDVLAILNDGWDMAVFHPPCTYLCRAGIHWNRTRPERVELTEQALVFVQQLMAAPIDRWALENPVSIISGRIRKPDQVIQPWHFGVPEKKATCLWLKNLRPLVPTHIDGGDLFAAAAPIERAPKVHYMAPGPNRWKERSRTYLEIAAAMANQWG